MDVFNRILRHGDLFEGMVSKLGLGSSISGLPNAAEVKRRAMARCMNCSEPDACAKWLDAHEHADEAPDYCRNHDMLERLKLVGEAGPVPG